MKYLCVWFAVVTIISAAVPQDICETCVPTQECPLFEKLNVTDQLKWMEKFPCGSRNKDFSVPAGFASAAKGDYVCCSNNIWGVEKPNHFGPHISHQPWTNSQSIDINNYSFNDDIGLKSNNYSNDDLINRSDNKNSFHHNPGIHSINSNNEEFNNYYYNKYIRSRGAGNRNSYNNNSSRNLDNYTSNPNTDHEFVQNYNDSTVWFPDRSRNYDNTDYWLTHGTDNNEDNNNQRNRNDQAGHEENIKETQLPPWNQAEPPNYYNSRSWPPNQFVPPEVEARPPILFETPNNGPITKYPPPNIVRPPIQYVPPENVARPPHQTAPSEHVPNFPVTNYPQPNIRQPIQHGRSGNGTRPSNQFDRPGMDAKPPVLYNPSDKGPKLPFDNNPPLNVVKPPNKNEPRPPGQFDPPGSKTKQPILFDTPENGADFSVTNYPPHNIVRPPAQYEPPGHYMTRPPHHYDLPRKFPDESQAILPIQNIPPGYDDTIRPPQKYYPPRNFRPPKENIPPGNFIPPNENYSPGIFAPPNENYPPGNFGPHDENYYSGNFGPPNQYHPRNFAPPNQYDPPESFIPPSQYFPSVNTGIPPQYLPDDYIFMPEYSNTNNFPYNNDQRNPRHNYYNFNTNKPHFLESPYKSYNQDKSLGNLGGSQCSVTSFPPEPQSGCCGRQLVDDDRITGWNNKPAYSNNNWGSRPRSDSIWRYQRSISENDDNVTVERRISGGHATELYQFPWTVLLLTTFDYGRREAAFNCGGGLISAKYVLTAGHCVFDKGASVKSVQVNLAEYDKSSFPRDCKWTGSGRQCIENIVMYAEEVITHPQYENENLVNDIALLRLRGSAPYTEYIRPICLPSFNIDDPQFVKTQFDVAGWGRVGPFSSNIKQSTVLYLVNHNQCRRYYPQLTNKHLCAAGNNGKDTCKGDSGGPLMLQQRGKYYVVGIVSGKRADSPCGTEVPSLYTNVYHYVGWIRSVIRN